ncbi:MAG: SMP-30/gluconolactonase/LRE family protein [Nocardioides sp.]
MKHTLISLATAAMLPALVLATPAAADRGGRPDVYHLTGDSGGSKFEGIGTDQRRDTFYVSEVTGGEIHRGTARSSHTEQWLDGDGTDGRFTARGITTDRDGNVYIAGGPNGLGTGRPDLWVYSRSGKLLAALRAPADNVFLNDVWVGPDGAAYFTNSNAPQIFRVADGDDGYQVELWADATGTIATVPGFNLGGILTSPDRRALIVAQSTTGQLWRFDLDDASVTPVDTGGADLTNADGLVRRGSKLTVVRNFPRVVTMLRLAADGSSARLVSERASDPDRVLTTAKALRGRILYVDSHFDEPVAAPPYEVLTNPFARDRAHREH